MPQLGWGGREGCGDLGLADVPPEVLALILSWLPLARDIARALCANHLFGRARMPGALSPVERALCLRAVRRGQDPKAAAWAPTGGDKTSASRTQALFWEERRLAFARPSVVSAGLWHVTAVDADGQLLTCGGGLGQKALASEGMAAEHMRAILGLGHFQPEAARAEEAVHVPALSPVCAMGGVRAIEVAAGPEHTIVLAEGGRVYTYGLGRSGKLGHGDELDQPSPRLVEALAGVHALGVDAGGQHSLVRDTSGALFSFGYGNYGLGHGETRDQLTPKRVDALEGVRVSDMSAGTFFSLVLSADGRAFAMGSGEHGKLGTGSHGHEPLPVQIEALNGVHIVAISAGKLHSLALTVDGHVYSFGDPSTSALGREHAADVHLAQMLGQGAECGSLVPPPGLDAGAGVGTRTAARPMLPARVAALDGVKVVAIAAGTHHSLVATSDGAVLSFGDGQGGELGHGDEIRRALPERVRALDGVRVVSVVAGVSGLRIGQSFAIAEDGAVFSWGRTGADMSKGFRDNVRTHLLPHPVHGVLTSAAGYWA